MKKILFLSVALLGAVCVEIYSSRQELKFDGGVPTYPNSARGEQTVPPGSVHCRFDNDGRGTCILSPYHNCLALPDDNCTGIEVSPSEPEQN